MSGLSDLPLPPNIERPEMWTTEAIVQAVKDGYTFLIPFISEGLFEPNAYWIHGMQASASSLTVGKDYTPEIELLPNERIGAKTFFPAETVPEEAWIGKPNEIGRVAVKLEISPEVIDWDLLNRGHQIRVKRGL